LFSPLDSPYEFIRERQRELREEAARAQLAARARHATAAARHDAPGRLSRAAQLVRAALARP
jgi:hypothetical protein